MLATDLLFIGAVLVVNGIWLVGSVRPAPQAAGTSGSDSATAGPQRGRSMVFDSKEVGFFNLLVGLLSFTIAMTEIIQGGVNGASITSDKLAWSYGLLFAFTYLWVAANQFLGSNGRAFGWYCLFVTFTAVPLGVISIARAPAGHVWPIWLGASWIIWGLLWGMFWGLLALEKSGKYTTVTGIVTVLVGIGTCWLPAFLLLEGYMAAT